MKASLFHHNILLPVILFLIGNQMTNGQSLDRVVIASTGQNLSSSTGTLSFTLGETVVATLNSDLELSQGFYQEWAILTAVKDDFANEFHVSIYPNPTSGWLNVSSDVMAHISLFDLSGKVVFQGEKEAGTYNIDVGDLTQGMYMLVMHDDKGMKATFKVEVMK